MKPFDKSDAASRKFLAQDLYALTPQILPYNEVDLVDLRYLNTDFAPVAHPFNSSFDIEIYNSMWFDDHPPLTRPPLSVVCKNSLPPTVELPSISISSPCSQPETIEEMEASLLENSNIDTQIDDVVTEEQITAAVPLLLAALHQ